MAVKFPSERQPATTKDDRGLEFFTRPWFLFFQEMWRRQGGALDASISEGTVLGGDIASNVAVVLELQNTVGQLQGAISTMQAQITELDKTISGFGQNPLNERNLVAELNKKISDLEQQNPLNHNDQIAELVKTIDDLKQGVLI
jgi:hypothetical protein